VHEVQEGYIVTTKARRVALALAASVVCSLAPAPAALAAKSTAKAGAKQPTTTTLAMTYEYVWNSPNPAAPTWCLNEDDFHIRTWTGALAGSFATSDRLCDANVDYSGGLWWDAGGIGIGVDLYATGTLTDMTITSPLGDVHHAVLVASSTDRGVTTNHYQACFVPSFSLANNVGGPSLLGGTWQMGVSGSLTQARFNVDAEMADVTFQQQHCPALQQNLV
jgi:hypothetical protein